MDLAERLRTFNWKGFTGTEILLSGIVLVLLLVSLFSICSTKNLQGDISGLKNQVNSLKSAAPAVSVNTPAVAPTPVPVDEDKLRIEDKFRRGVYDEETISFAFLEIEKDLDSYTRQGGQTNPDSLSYLALDLYKGFDYLVEGMGQGYVEVSAVNRLINRYKGIEDRQYVPSLESYAGGKQLTEVFTRFHFTAGRIN